MVFVGYGFVYSLACSAPNHYLNQCWLLITHTPRNNLKKYEINHFFNYKIAVEIGIFILLQGEMS